MASETVVMPELGESVVEGVIVEWLVKLGDEVKVDDPLCEIETDKANAEIPSPRAGYISDILAQVDDVIEVGSALVRISDEPPEGVQAASSSQASSSGSSGGASAQHAKAPSSPAPPRDTAQRAQARSAPQLSQFNGGGGGEGGAQPVSTPPSSWMNRLSNLPQSSGGGNVSAAQPRSGTPQATPGTQARKDRPERWLPFGHPDGAQAYRYPAPRVEDGDTVEKFSRRRQIISEHMVISQSVSPHVVTVAEVDMSDVVTLRSGHKDRLKAQGIRLTYMSFILKATCLALREFPIMNAVVGDRQVIRKGKLNLGFAAETDAGLVVPVIKNADELNLVGLAKAVSRLATKARNNDLEPDDISGGTFTVSNPGLRGNLYGGAIINQPQVGILRMGEMKKRPMVVTRDGQDVIAIRTMMYMALSYDHRAIDGVTGNGFLYRVRELLEQANFHL